MTSRQKLTEIWPIFGLTIKTPRLELKLSDGSDLPELAKAARTIQGSDEVHFQQAWMYEPSPKMERELLQRYWNRLGSWTANDWHLKFVAYLDDQPIGLQDIWAEKFPAKRSVYTGSWLTLEQQGKGYGTEMRLGVLELAFGKLGAVEALTDYREGNDKSNGVSRKLGYIDNGQSLALTEGERFTKHFMRLTTEAWKTFPDKPKIEVIGLEPCLEMLGLDTE